MMLLRRHARLEPLEITTAAAPVLADGHIDICAGDVPPVASPAQIQPDPEPEPDWSVQRNVGPVPPGYEPGVCGHPAHAVIGGLRYGVTPTDSSAVPNLARLTPCHHRNRDGF